MSNNITVFKLIDFPLLAAALLSGADTTGTISGTIADPSHSFVAQARLELINENTNVRSTQLNNSDGLYGFNLMPPGRYTVAASAPGFHSAATTGVLVEVNRNTRVDVALQLGQVAETIEVSASTTQIDSVSAQVATNVDKTYVTELPSISRNILAFAEFAPGVQMQNQLVLPALTGVVGTSAVVNGNRTGANALRSEPEYLRLSSTD